MGEIMKLRLHPKALENRRQRLPDLGARQVVRRRERRAQEEAPGLRIAELRAVGDVPALDGETAGDRGNDAGLVGTGEGEDEGGVAAGHPLKSLPVMLKETIDRLCTTSIIKEILVNLLQLQGLFDSTADVITDH